MRSAMGRTSCEPQPLRLCIRRVWNSSSGVGSLRPAACNVRAPSNVPAKRKVRRTGAGILTTVVAIANLGWLLGSFTMVGMIMANAHISLVHRGRSAVAEVIACTLVACKLQSRSLAHEVVRLRPCPQWVRHWVHGGVFVHFGPWLCVCARKGGTQNHLGSSVHGQKDPWQMVEKPTMVG